MDVAHHGLAAVLVGVVGQDHAGVVHDGGDVRGLAPGGAGHVQYSLPRLGGQSHHREQGARALKDGESIIQLEASDKSIDQLEASIKSIDQ